MILGPDLESRLKEEQERKREAELETQRKTLAEQEQRRKEQERRNEEWRRQEEARWQKEEEEKARARRKGVDPWVCNCSKCREYRENVYLLVTVGIGVVVLFVVMAAFMAGK